MVSLWPWRRDDSSTASFEKTLSTLSKKIADSQAKLDRTRASARRVKVLSTLYLSFAYLIYTIILLVVIGWKNLGAYEWTGMAGGPVLIYLVRTIVATYYNFRIDSLAARLKDQQTERAKTIQKLKDATKYDSTLQLLEKYGGVEAKPKGGKKKGDDGDASELGLGQRQNSRSTHGTPNRTGMPPPPTANIQRPSPFPQSAPGTPTPNPQSHSLTTGMRPPSLEPGEEFAQNAFDHAPIPGPQLAQFDPTQSAAAAATVTGPHWYDRILDLILGEDETAPKNRIILICQHCRLVNGQAPPGTTSLAQLGTWKCLACGALNGETELDEGKKVVKEILAGKTDEAQAGGSDTEASSTREEISDVDASKEARRTQKKNKRNTLE